MSNSSKKANPRNIVIEIANSAALDFRRQSYKGALARIYRIIRENPELLDDSQILNDLGLLHDHAALFEKNELAKKTEAKKTIKKG